ncbi:MAG: hypothetical protein LUE17_01190, partial [Planctomycetaceae bacterium]|nr:hypothetical protein [Planctomycetaceae bacterium]
MNREQNCGKEPGRHISMELTAESARVTRLSLNGNRLVVTIEAELSDSKVTAAEEEAAAAAAARSATQHRPYPRKDTELVRRAPTSPAAAPEGANAAPDAATGAVMGSENLPPVPAAYSPGAGTSPDGAITQQDALVTPPPIREGSAPDESTQPSLHDTQPILGFGAAVETHETETDVNPELIPLAPPLEPVRELTDTWDEPGQPVVHEALSPVSGTYDEQDHKETHPDENVHETEEARPWTEITLPAPQPVPGGAPVIGLAPSPSMDDDGLAITEESSAIGGDRHGEPQPTISFGTDNTPLRRSRGRPRRRRGPSISRRRPG